MSPVRQFVRNADGVLTVGTGPGTRVQVDFPASAASSLPERNTLAEENLRRGDWARPRANPATRPAFDRHVRRWRRACRRPAGGQGHRPGRPSRRAGLEADHAGRGGTGPAEAKHQRTRELAGSVQSGYSLRMVNFAMFSAGAGAMHIPRRPQFGGSNGITGGPQSARSSLLVLREKRHRCAKSTSGRWRTRWWTCMARARNVPSSSKTDAMRTRGQMEGFSVWVRVLDVILRHPPTDARRAGGLVD